MNPKNEDELSVADSLESLFSLPPPRGVKIQDPKQNTSSSHKIISKEQEETLAITTIQITAHALQKMFFMAKEVVRIFNEPLEVYALAIGSTKVIQDILIPVQTCSFTSIHINAEDLLSLMPAIQKQDVTVLGWTHSHANFGVFFSETDIQNQKIILAETSNYIFLDGHRVKFCYGMTVNINQEVFGMVSTQFSSGNIHSKPVSFDVLESPNEGSLSDLEETTLSQILRDNIIRIKNHE